METLIKNFVKIFRRDIRLLRNGSMLIAAALLALALAVGANSAAFKLHNLISIRSLTIEDHNRAMDWRIDIRHQSGLEIHTIGKIAPIMTYEMMLRRFYD